MEFSNRQWIISLLCGLVLVVAVTNGEEAADNAVEMKLYQASEADWDSTGRGKYKDIVAVEATAYCGDNKEDCYGEQPTFETSGYEEVSVERVKAYLEVKYSMKFPKENKYLTKNTLKAITINAAAKFKDQTDMTIVDVDGESQPLAPNTTLNIAISCTAIVIIIALVIALLIMQHKCGGHDHELLVQKEEAVNSHHGADEKDKTTARGGTVATLQSVVTDDTLPAKSDGKAPTASLQTTDM